jgi:hypothetical protein
MSNKSTSPIDVSISPTRKNMPGSNVKPSAFNLYANSGNMNQNINQNSNKKFNQSVNQNLQMHRNVRHGSVDFTNINASYPLLNNNSNNNSVFNIETRISNNKRMSGVFTINNFPIINGMTSMNNVNINNIPMTTMNMKGVVTSTYMQPNINLSTQNSLLNMANINNLNTVPTFNLLNDEKYLMDNILILLKDQNGCRLVQKKIEEKNNEFILQFFEKVQNNLYEIINDQFGNYVIQKFLEAVYDDKKTLAIFFDKVILYFYYI